MKKFLYTLAGLTSGWLLFGAALPAAADSGGTVFSDLTIARQHVAVLATARLMTAAKYNLAFASARNHVVTSTAPGQYVLELAAKRLYYTYAQAIESKISEMLVLDSPLVGTNTIKVKVTGGEPGDATDLLNTEYRFVFSPTEEFLAEQAVPPGELPDLTIKTESIRLVRVKNKIGAWQKKYKVKLKITNIGRAVAPGPISVAYLAPPRRDSNVTTTPTPVTDIVATKGLKSRQSIMATFFLDTAAARQPYQFFVDNINAVDEANELNNAVTVKIATL